jgi:hypothetical protein
MKCATRSSSFFAEEHRAREVAWPAQTAAEVVATGKKPSKMRMRFLIKI